MNRTQLPLQLRPRTEHVCAFGETGNDWGHAHHCGACAAAVEAAGRACEGEIAAGRYDVNLYTPAEAKAARKRGTYLAMEAA